MTDFLSQFDTLTSSSPSSIRHLPSPLEKNLKNLLQKLFIIV